MVFVKARRGSQTVLHAERLSSKKTEALFLGLALATLLLALWRQSVAGGTLATLLFAGFLFFLFYALNYRTLTIRLTRDELRLRFGLFRWTISLDNVERCFLDETSLRRVGGAGIHFSSFEGRYRAMFNFLEYPRVVVALKQKRGPVREVAFSTREPEEIVALIRELATRRQDVRR
jgi:hypothetical protein